MTDREVDCLSIGQFDVSWKILIDINGDSITPVKSTPPL